MKTTAIYAAYLPDSTTPAYIGSHNLPDPDKPLSPSLQWRHTQCTYLGQGCWRGPDGALITQPCPANLNTLWGRYLVSLSPAQLLAIRIEVLSVVPTTQRWRHEAQALRTYKPPYNALVPQTLQARRTKWAAYQRLYGPAYLKAHPDKLEAKRRRDRERLAAKRAAAKANSHRPDPDGAL